MKLFRKETYGTSTTYYYIGKWEWAKKRDTQFEIGNWYVGWQDWKFEIVYRVCGYEEGNGELHLSLFGWHSVFKFPWKSRRFPDGDCDVPSYGIAIHDNTFWVYRGGDGNMNGGSKWWTWDLPFFTWEHIRHDVECMDEDEEVTMMMSYDLLVNERNNWEPLEKKELVNKRYYDFLDKYDNTRVPCIYWMEEREWRRKGFKWLDWDCMKKVRKYIEVRFDGEVGERKGTWKGGVTACSYELRPGESPYLCIRRMERERKM